MNYKMMGRIMALILLVEALFMTPSVVLSLVDGKSEAAAAFLWTMAIMFAIAGLLAFVTRKASGGFYAREGLVCVGSSWIIMSLAGCLPFYFSHEIPHFIDALFEIVSGFTTTGASILLNVEGLSRGMLYWRSFSHWLGGMGVLVFILAVIPVSGRNNGFALHILRAESPGPNVSKLVPRMRRTAMILYIIYVGLTLLNIILFLAGGMPVFDSVCTSFGIAGTGGFGIKNDSMAGYSVYMQNVATVFMLLFGVNFTCYYLLLMRQIKGVFKNEELRLYIGIFVVSASAITLNVLKVYPTVSESIRHSAFQVASIMTTTGFATTDFDVWPAFSKAILLCLMIVGACAGSTGGGIKCGRALLLVKILRRNVRKVLHPHKVQVIRCDGQVIDESVLENTTSYLAAYVLILLASFVVISLDGFSVATNLSAVIACFNNIGPGLELVGPTGNYASFGVLSKVVLIVDMLAGRLEIFPIMILFSRSTWLRK